MKKDPTQIDLSNLSFNSKAFMERLSSALVSAADTDFGSATAHLLGKKDDRTVEQKTFNLIVKALQSACINILKDGGEHQLMLDAIKDLSTKTTKINTEIVKSVKDLKLSIGPDIFITPHQSDFVKKIKDLYQQWLNLQIGFTEAQSISLAALVPYRFLLELAYEWRQYPEAYGEIETYFKNPFFEIIKNEYQKNAYYASLQSFYSEPVFGSPEMTLADIYIEPNFKVFKKSFKEKIIEANEFDSDGFCEIDSSSRSLHAFILDAFKDKIPHGNKLASKNADFTILVGQPGQGKTSFCLRTLYDLISKDFLTDRNLFFVRLRHMNNVKDTINNPLETLRKHIAKTERQSDTPTPISDFENAILILDGLDELYMQQGLKNSDIKDFVINLSKELITVSGLKILITTRYNYLNIEDLSGEKFLILKLDELSLDQQQEWLKKYKLIYPTCNLTKETISEINNSGETKYDGIKELINQPILLQMIARSGLDVKEGSNRAKIYETLFDNIINRKWSKDGQLEKYEKLKKNDLRNLLQTIALGIFHSDFEYIRRNDFEAIEILKKAKDKFLEKTNNELQFEDALKEILVSFYFKNKKKDIADTNDKDRKNDYAIEFLHKSLHEFLVAEKIYRSFKSIFLRKDREGDYFTDDWKIALKEVYLLSSPKMITSEIRDYLVEVINNDIDVSEKDELVDRLNYFLPFLLQRDFIYKYDAETNGINPINGATGTFYIYWTVLSHLQEKNSLDINEVAKERFAFFLRSFGEGFNELKLKGINLASANLFLANLYYADLSGANLVGVNLAAADLRGVNLIAADLRDANLTGADLIGADLSGAKVHFSQLLEVSSLYGTKGIPKKTLEKLKKEKPSLFEKPSYLK